MRHSGKYDVEIDKKNTQRMKEIVAQYGWPTISKVGESGVAAAWLLVQHADLDVDFQEYCLGLMKKESEEEVKKSFIAYLEDRVRIAKGKPQLYGTQFHKNTKGVFVPKPIEDEPSVAVRRKEMGLPSLEESTASMNKY